uniref:WD domain, G-beta repeat, putative n=1 Tax=Theileria annulata TaxID=5874 RepID=A0A3B0N373_THEAN
MLLVCGGYEGVLLGLDYDREKLETLKIPENPSSDCPSEKNEIDGQNAPFTQLFRVSCSQGSIKCMDLNSNVLVCGGSDETVQVYNIEKMSKHGEIMLPEGYITSVAVFGGVNKGSVLVGNEYGEISLFLTRDLSFQKSFKGHKKEISGISFHSEGKAFISVSLDCYLRLWDLNSKTCVFNTQLNFPPINVKWSNGSKYILSSENQVLVCSGEDDTFKTVKSPTNDKVTCCSWYGDSAVVIGFKSGVISVHSVDTHDHSDKVLASCKVHNKRVKSVVAKNGYIFSGDSEGTVLCCKILDEKLHPILKHYIGFRLNVLVS